MSMEKLKSKAMKLIQTKPFYNELKLNLIIKQHNYKKNQIKSVTHRPFSQNKQIINYLVTQDIQKIQSNSITYYKNEIQQKTKNSNSNQNLRQSPNLTNKSRFSQLNYSRNNISIIPKYLVQYVNLKHLDISNNQIVKIDIICELLGLQKLYLNNNLINQVPKSIRNLNKLQFLDLSYNKFWYLSQLLPLKQLRKIRVAHMSSNINILLSENSIVKTNKKAVQTLLTLNNQKEYKLINLTQQQKQQKQKISNNLMPLHSNLNKNQQSYRNQINLSKQGNQLNNKKQDNPMNLNNKDSFITNNKESSNKYNKTKSINQSLLDISAIINSTYYPFQKEQQLKDKNNNRDIQNLQKSTTQKQYITKQLNSIQYKNTQKLSERLDTLQLSSPNFKDIEIQNLQKTNFSISIINIIKKSKDFERIFLKPINKLQNQFRQICKKIEIISKIQKIPDFFEENLKIANYLTLQTISIILNIVSPFHNFQYENSYFSDKQNISNSKLKILSLQTLRTQIKQNNDKIIQSFINLQKLSQTKLYEVWIHQYRKLDQKTHLLLKLLNDFYDLWQRSLKIQQISKISSFQQQTNLSDKQNKMQNIQEKIFCTKNYQDKQLNKLLFSQIKDKRSSLQSSGQKNSIFLTQRKFQNENNNISNLKCKVKNGFQNQICLQCPIKDQQILLLKAELVESQYKIAKNMQEIKELESIINFYKSKHKCEDKIFQQQQQIIERLQNFNPSTYQYILLQQAKAVENLIDFQTDLNANHSIFFKNQQKIQNQQTQKKFVKSHQPSTQSGNRQYNENNQNQNLRQYQLLSQFTLPSKQMSKSQGIYLSKDKNSQTKKDLSQIKSRAYFKSNGSASFGDSINIQNKAISSLNKSLSKQLKIKDTNRLNQFLKLQQNVGQYNKRQIKSIIKTRKTSQYLKTSNINKENKKIKNITVTEFVQDFNQQNDINYSNSYQMIKNDNIQNKKDKIIHKEQNQYQNDSKYNIQQIQLKSQMIKKITNDFPEQIKTLKSSQIQKQTSNTQTIRTNTYDCKYLQINQKEDYKKYIKNHLRNNIKEILLKSTQNRLLRSKSHKQIDCRYHIDQFNSHNQIQDIIKRKMRYHMKSYDQLKNNKNGLITNNNVIINNQKGIVIYNKKGVVNNNKK